MAYMKSLTVSGQTYQVKDPEAVSFAEHQPLTPAQQAQARENMGVLSEKLLVDKLCPSFTESGAIVTCEPVEGYPLEVTAEEGATKITRCGKNVFDPAFFTNNGWVENGGVYSGFCQDLASKKIYCAFKENTQYTFSFYSKASGSGEIGLHLHVRYTDGTSAQLLAVKSSSEAVFYTNTTLADKTVDYIAFSYAMNLETYLWDFQAGEGTTATAYEPYNSGIFAPGEPITALSGVNTIFADAGLVTVKGKADPVAIINKLTNAVLAMGSNV